MNDKERAKNRVKRTSIEGDMAGKLLGYQMQKFRSSGFPQMLQCDTNLKYQKKNGNKRYKAEIIMLRAIGSAHLIRVNPCIPVYTPTASYPALPLADNLETCYYYALNHTRNLKLRPQM